jgi:hypothetical protein
VNHSGAFWSAPAERSGDGALVRTGRERTKETLRPGESGVAPRFPPQSKIAGAGKPGVNHSGTFWSAPAERSGDGALVRTGRERTKETLRPGESGVAPRFPPQSKIAGAGEPGVNHSGTFWSAPAERSGDGALVRTGRERTLETLRPGESGVALRFPPQSKIAGAEKADVNYSGAFWRAARRNRLANRGRKATKGS